MLKKQQKKNKKQITKAFLNASPQIHKTTQNQNIPNQPKTTNKAFLNALIHKYKQKITPNQPKATSKTSLETLTHKHKLKQQIHQHQQNSNQPNNNQTKPNKTHLNTHNANTTKHPIIQPTPHTKEYKTTPEKNQNIHPKKEGKNLHKIIWARPTGLAQVQAKKRQNKNSNKTIPIQTNTTNPKHKHPITHTHNVTTHPKITKLTLHTKTYETTTTIQQNTHQKKEKVYLCKNKRARPNGLAQVQSTNKLPKTTNIPNNNSKKHTNKLKPHII